MNPEIFAKELAKYGFELNEKQQKQFATYYDKLVEFNKKVNLTRITDKNEVYLKHFFDSITPLLEFPDLFKGEKTLCDVGAGAGFPSLPIKILCPNLSITIVDSLGKRLKFLDELEINMLSHNVKVRGESVILTNTEYKILLLLAKNPSRVFSREQLLELTIDEHYEKMDRIIDAHIKNLRQKIELDTKKATIIQTVYGVGYKFGL